MGSLQHGRLGDRKSPADLPGNERKDQKKKKKKKKSPLLSQRGHWQVHLTGEKNRKGRVGVGPGREPVNCPPYCGCRLGIQGFPPLNPCCCRRHHHHHHQSRPQPLPRPFPSPTPPPPIPRPPPPPPPPPPHPPFSPHLLPFSSRQWSPWFMVCFEAVFPKHWPANLVLLLMLLWY